MARNITAAHNGFDPEVLKRFVKDIDRIEDEIASLKGEHAKKVRDKKDLIKGHLERAAAAGIPTKELKGALAIRNLERKARQKREEFEGEEIETVDQIRFALGDLADLPLGQAAVEAKSGGKTERKPRTKRGAPSPANDDEGGSDEGDADTAGGSSDDEDWNRAAPVH